VTAPYQFAIANAIATSATSPIANPKTGEYVGQTLLDFYPEGVKEGLKRLGALIAFVITPEVDATGGDTVVGPNVTEGWESASILDLLFMYDPPGSHFRLDFEQRILAKMKNGTEHLEEFGRTKKDGKAEHLVIAFAPVYQRVLLPLSPDDFSRGVEVSQVLLYSVGMIRRVDEIHAPFREIEDDIKRELDDIRTVYVVVTAFVALIFTAYACLVSTFPRDFFLHHFVSLIDANACFYTVFPFADDALHCNTNENSLASGTEY